MARTLLLVTGLTLAIAACGRAPSSQAPRTAAGTTPEPALEGRLDIVAWPGYVERGATDRGRDWVTEFERKTACKVTLRTAASSDEMVDLMDHGGYDLVTASGDAALRLIAAGQVQPVDIARIPSYKSIDARLRDAAWHTVDGVHYGVPFQWGPNLLMYDQVVFKTPPDSWRVVYEEMTLPDGKSNRGRVQAFDSPISIADAAVFLMHDRPELGIRDPYALSEAQYAAALGVLKRQRSLVHRYWRDPQVQMDDFRNEGVAASTSWPAQVHALQASSQLVGSVIPKEGATGWADTTMLHARALHPNCAYKWMEWSLDQKVQGDVAASFGSVPSVPAACKGNAALGETGCMNNGAGDFGRLFFWRTPQARCSRGKCVPYSRWTGDYARIVDG